MAKLELKIGDKTYNKAWVDNLSSTSQITSDAASINYGVVASTGNATLHDNNGQIRADIENGVLPISNAPTKVILNDTQVQEHTTSDSDYSIIDKELNLQFSDRLSLLDKVTYSGMPLRDYSMTAYEMLDDVIGSYGGYCKNEPINWAKYQNGSNISTASKSAVITVATSGGWEIIGTPIRVTKNKACSIQYSISTQTEYTVGSGQGIAIQVLNSVPTDSNCEDIALASAFLGTTAVDNIGTLNFTPTTDAVYLVVNFGYASDGQTIKVRINSVRVDGKSPSLSVRGKKYISHSRNGYLGVTTQTIRDFLDSKILEYPYLPSASYRETIEKFCTLAQITLALDNDGYIYFYDARPCIKGEVESEIPKSYQIKNLNKTLFLKNKVDGVDIKQSRVKDEVVVATNIYNWDSTLDQFSQFTDKATATDVSISITYYNGIITIPKRSVDNLEQMKRLSDFKFSCTGTHSSGTVEKTWSDTGTSYKFNYTSKQKETWQIEKFSESNISGSQTATLENRFALVITQDEDNYLIQFSIPTNETYWYYEVYGGKTNSDLQDYTAEKLEVSLYGDKRVVSFVESNLSTPNIKSANNAVSIPTNELMQNESDVKAIRDNILEDYANGVPTADIDLFYDENNKINKGDIICFNDDLSKYDDMNLWRVTGKTLKYNGYPSLSLELQRQKSWHITDYWSGSVKVDNISNGDFTEDTATTKSGTISLPRAFGKDYYFRAVITYMVNDTPFNNDTNGIGSISDSQLMIGTLARVHCNLSISDDGTKVYYTAEEVYKEVGLISKTVYKGYVKSINIVAFRYTEFD